MMRLENDAPRGRGRPATDAKPILVRIAPDDLALLDAFRGSEADEPTRPEAIRRLLHRGFGTLSRKLDGRTRE